MSYAAASWWGWGGAPRKQILAGTDSAGLGWLC